MDSKDLPPPHGTIECFGEFEGPEVLLLVGHGGDCATFHIAESYLRHLGPRWKALQGVRAHRLSRGLFRGLLSGVFGGSYGGVFRNPFTGLRGFDKNPRILNLKGDYPDAIRILLQIVTMEFTKLPEKLDFPELVRLAEVAARWDCHAMLAKFIEGWAAPYRDRIFLPGYEQWLYIAHEFGYEDEYLELSRRLAICCSIDSQDRLVTPDGSVLEQRGIFPLDTLFQIHEGRRQILHSIIKALYDLWAIVANGSSCQLADETNSYDYRSCAGVNLIEFTEYLRGKGLFPMIKTVEPIRYSPFELARYVDTELLSHTVDLDSEGSSSPRPTPPHIDCHVGFQLGPVMQNILDNARWPVEISIVDRIRSNTCEYRLDPAFDDPYADVDGTPVLPRELV
ncbi:uncharacterized protein M421DRAFT_7922 [Didymella exigua CBS 183.55]|uniref:Uncharacterized protein n=1 Tax=Didymella exigua CBS 183.55 TaxID=1150837 RepID=A0A6A5RIM9_9PLEO|nr:uncharacterized protein M421DRAFT_7922 [Didymella exigua CBS 183.55]KAF1925447.1 hypothetical protein M421DRAFT_7922 [Didymella exigua CBS 183.55]